MVGIGKILSKISKILLMTSIDQTCSSTISCKTTPSKVLRGDYIIEAEVIAEMTMMKSETVISVRGSEVACLIWIITLNYTLNKTIIKSAVTCSQSNSRKSLPMSSAFVLKNQS